jgi:ankyrin repeat protein
MAAAAEGDEKLVEALIDIGADLEATDPDGRTALMWAALEGQADIAEILLLRGAEIDVTDNDGGTAQPMPPIGFARCRANPS